MTGQEVVFILVAIATGTAAVATVTSKNLVHAALFLAVTLVGIAGSYLVLHADFVAMVQLVVYVGAVAVLFLFGLMLTRAPIGREALDSQNRAMGAGIAVTMFIVMVALIVEAFRDTGALDLASPSVAEIGTAIFANWVFPFEVLSMLLLGALVGAILMSRRESGESGEETPVTRIQMDELTEEDKAADKALTTSGGGDA